MFIWGPGVVFDKKCLKSFYTVPLSDYKKSFIAGIPMYSVNVACCAEYLHS